ncbi:MAG: hypothetical protein JWL61_4977 [Gemmatimonadetes bacterium]|nr:hypothetical protein [Gemmatimonadota bacterium]
MSAEWCDRCDGCGWYEGDDDLNTTCAECRGTGIVNADSGVPSSVVLAVDSSRSSPDAPAAAVALPLTPPPQDGTPDTPIEPRDEKVAAVERHVDAVCEKLRDWSRHMAARFNGAVYLVGSTLHHPTPRDTDIRIVIADHEFAARYDMPMAEIPAEKQRERNGVTRTQAVPFDAGITQRWVDDMAKLTAAVSIRLTHNADVKVWPDSYWREPYPTPITLAAPSRRWFLYNRHNPKPPAIVEFEAQEAAASSSPPESPLFNPITTEAP